MSKIYQIVVFLGLTAATALFAAYLYLQLPATAFTDEKIKALVSFGGAFAVALLSAFWSSGLSSLSERPRAKIEHINVKTERDPLSLPVELYWFIVREDSFLKFVDSNVSWKISSLQINEIKYYQLNDLDKLLPKFIVRYKATSAWVEAFLSSIKQYEEAKQPVEKEAFKQRLIPYLNYLASSYESEKKSSIHNDFATKCDEVINYLKNSLAGLHFAHLEDLKKYQEFHDWVVENLKSGVTPPKKIDNKEQIVPEINFVVGISNLGKTSVLVKDKAIIYYKGKSIYLKGPGARSFFGKIQPTDVDPVHYVVDTSKTNFADHKLIFENLVSTGLEKIKLEVELAEGSIKSKVLSKLKEDDQLPI